MKVLELHVSVLIIFCKALLLSLPLCSSSRVNLNEKTIYVHIVSLLFGLSGAGSNFPLVLDGTDMKLISIKINSENLKVDTGYLSAYNMNKFLYSHLYCQVYLQLPMQIAQMNLVVVYIICDVKVAVVNITFLWTYCFYFIPLSPQNFRRKLMLWTPAI